MESTGKTDKIQVSQKTADLLKAAGKQSWLTPREEFVSAKGKVNSKLIGSKDDTEISLPSRSHLLVISVLI